MPEHYTDTATIDAEDMTAGATPGRLPHAREYPAPLDSKAYRGIFGDLVGILAPHTEADPAALLLQAIIAFGNIIGRGPYFLADGARHHTNLFGVIVAASAKGRKGTSWQHIRNTFSQLDPTWRHVGGLATGEGLIDQVRDEVTGIKDGQPTIVREGVEDKRVLVMESEFARVLRVGEREGATLSPILRECWDSGDLASLSKNAPSKATGAHISIIGHITAPELRRYLTATETGNGFGNRFLWVCARRSRYLPDGGQPSATALAHVGRDIQLAVDHARQRGQVQRDSAARQYWHAIYRDLSEGRPGLLGAMTGRAEAQVARLALIFCLADATPTIELEHLEAAEAVWHYCYRSAGYIFGDTLGDAIADDLLVALRDASDLGVTRTEMNKDIFSRNRSRAQIAEGLNLLRECGLARCEIDNTGAGRPVERWYSTSP